MKKCWPWGGHVRGTVRSAKYADSLPAGVNAVQIESIGPDTDWSEALKGVDTVVYLAARVHVMHDTAADPLAAFRQVNVIGMEHLARMAAIAGASRFIYMSSVKVNGEGRALPYREVDKPAPIDPYGISKWEAEQVLDRIANETRMEVVVLRSPLVYGPGVKANFLRLLQMVDLGIPLPLANINNRRSLIYLGNLVGAVIACIEHTRAAGQTFLVSDGEDVSTPDLIRRVAASLGREVRLFAFPASLIRLAGKLSGKSAAGERLLSSLTVDSTKIRRELDWETPYTMEHGLAETAEWYKQKKIGN